MTDFFYFVLEKKKGRENSIKRSFFHSFTSLFSFFQTFFFVVVERISQMATVMDVRLKRQDKVYHPSETVSGLVIVQNKGVQSHNGIYMTVDGVVQLQLSSKSVGVFQAFYDSIKPITMLSLSFEVAKPGKLFVSPHRSIQ